MWRCPFKLYFEALTLTEKMNRLLLWTPVHLHRASFSTTKHNMCGRVLCKLQLQHLKNLADAWVSGQWCRCTISPEPGIWTKSQPSSQKPCPVNLLVSKCEISKPGLKLRKWSSQDGKVALARNPGCPTSWLPSFQTALFLLHYTTKRGAKCLKNVKMAAVQTSERQN